MSTYVTRTNPNYFTDDAAGLPIEQVREWLAMLDAASSAALNPSRALLDASLARATAVDLAGSFASVGPLIEGAIAERRRLQANTTMRHEVLRQQWAEFGSALTEQAARIPRTIATASDELRVALRAEALPSNPDPAATLIARQEVELALEVAGSAGGNIVLLFMEQAARGGDVSAAVATEWGRLRLLKAAGDDVAFEMIVDRAVEAAAASPDEAQRRAAAALMATRTPAPGRQVPALAEATVFAQQICELAARTVARGIVLT